MDEPLKQNSENKSSLSYEETPIIDPVSGEVASDQASVSASEHEDAASVVPEAARVFQSPPGVAAKDDPLSGDMHITEEHKKKPAKKNHIGTILFIVILFGLGVWLSSQLRTFFAPSVVEETVVPTLAPVARVSPSTTNVATPSGALPSGSRQLYNVISGVTKKPIDGLTYQMPSEVKAPVCDSQSCASQGTNLPGGTRFTVAARGKGQLLPDFRGAILTDAAGREFTMKQGVFGGVFAYEYTGNFTGRTGGGYTFTAIRGVLMPVSETLAVEFNHFAPAGITSDFASDDAVFNEIIASFKTGIVNTATPSVSLPAVTPTTTSAGF
jgi:hypothetical protein